MVNKTQTFPNECPACGKLAYYFRAMDRYVHDDGSENRSCWLRITRGEVEVKVANGRS